MWSFLRFRQRAASILRRVSPMRGRAVRHSKFLRFPKKARRFRPPERAGDVHSTLRYFEASAVPARIISTANSARYPR